MGERVDKTPATAEDYGTFGSPGPRGGTADATDLKAESSSLYPSHNPSLADAPADASSAGGSAPAWYGYPQTEADVCDWLAKRRPFLTRFRLVMVERDCVGSRHGTPYQLKAWGIVIDGKVAEVLRRNRGGAVLAEEPSPPDLWRVSAAPPQPAVGRTGGAA